MTARDFLDLAALGTMAILTVALILVVIRIIRGPTLPDRIVALDLLVGIVIGLIATFGVRTGHYAYLDIAIALGLVGFLSTVAFARYVLTRGRAGDQEPVLPDQGGDPSDRRPR